MRPGRAGSSRRSGGRPAMAAGGRAGTRRGDATRASCRRLLAKPGRARRSPRRLGGWDTSDRRGAGRHRAAAQGRCVAPERGALHPGHPRRRRRDLGLGPRRRPHRLLPALEVHGGRRRGPGQRPAHGMVRPCPPRGRRRPEGRHRGAPGGGEHALPQRAPPSRPRRQPRLGAESRGGGEGREGTGRASDRNDHGHHGAQGGRAPPPAHGRARRPHRPAQPQGVPRPVVPLAPACPAQRVPVRGALPGPRPLQAGQRQPRPRRR